MNVNVPMGMDGACPKTGADAQWERYGPFFHCTSCGSLKPEDAMALARSGWKVGRSGKPGLFVMKSSFDHEDEYEDMFVHTEHFETRQDFCELLSEALGGTWTFEEDEGKFVRAST